MALSRHHRLVVFLLPLQLAHGRIFNLWKTSQEGNWPSTLLSDDWFTFESYDSGSGSSYSPISGSSVRNWFAAESLATTEDLAFVEPNGSAVLRVDNTNVVKDGERRYSVSLATRERYGFGHLFVFDVKHVSSVVLFHSCLALKSRSQAPVGCSVWPSIWTRGGQADGGYVSCLKATPNTDIVQADRHLPRHQLQ